jgi:succinoglycan biosynthesis transport protein ExoP
VSENKNQPLNLVSGPEIAPAPPTFGERLDFVVGFLWRQYLVILIALLLSLPVGAWRYFTTPPSYTATATMMIESRKGALQSLLGETVADGPWVESQIGVLKSQNVAVYVVKQLRLAEDPDFVRSDAGLLDNVLARFGRASTQSKSDVERTAEATAVLRSQLEVRRVGQSFMINIEFRSPNPEQAVKIANAMIDGYVYDQLNAKYQSNRRAGDWLQERLQNLREQAASAERAVIEFKSKNNIVKAGGTLMNDKQLTELAGQLTTARAHASDLRARLERIQAVREAYQQDQPASTADEDISEAMNNGIITRLRTQYLDLVNREADFSGRLGKTHVTVINLRNQIRDLRKSIRDELGRIEETYKSEYEIAKKRQDESEKGLAAIVSQSTETNQAQVALFSLESAAQSYRKLYDSFLQQYTESVQQQSYPISDARPLSSASVIKTGPKAAQVWVMTILGGGLLGFGIGALRELLDRGFRTREQVRSVLETNCLGLVPMLENDGSVGVVPDRKTSLVALSGMRRKFARSVGRPERANNNDSIPRMLRAIFDAPLSPYAEAIRSVKVTLDLNGRSGKSKVLGLISCLPNEGKSTVAVAISALIAQSGARVVLVDCDIRNPSLSRALAPDADIGFLDVLAGGATLTDAIWTVPNTKMAFVPMVQNPDLPNPIEMLASDAADTTFSLLQAEYDYVIVDLAPLVAEVDTHVTSRVIDSYLLVIEWGTTKIDLVKYAVHNAPGLQKNIVGTVLNKVDMATIRRYDKYGANYYYSRSSDASTVS